MSIPTRSECLIIMDKVRMPDHIRKHSMMVAVVALYLGGLLNRNSSRLNLELLEAASLLHDIAKMESVESGGSHSELGARMLTDFGFLPLASIVEDHVTMDLVRVYGPINESVIVNYCDKRVKHDQMVTVKERFEDLTERYAKTEAHMRFMQEKYVLYMELERRIFEHLGISPNGEEVMNLSLEKAS